MYFATRHILLGACFIAFGVEAQIPPQPGRNPNVTPPGSIRPGVRPPTPGRPPVGGPNTQGAEARPAPRPEDAITTSGNVKLEYRNTELSIILLLYEDLTGLKVIRDANAEQATVSVDTTGELPKEKAIMFIEKSLLLNGYSFVPAGEGMVKLLSFDAKKPQAEGVRLFESAMDLPETDEIVSYVASLKYLSGEDAIKALDSVITRHSYGVLTAVPNARKLVIIENSATVRAMLAMLERLDNKPTATTSKTFQLVRSDAEDVKKALDEILGTDEKKSGSTGTTATPNRPVTPAQVQNAQGGVVQAAAASPVDYSDNSTTEIPPKIIAITRRNSLLVIATPETMQYIGTLIEELDAASELRNFVSRTLNYLGVDAAMSIISDAISRGEEDGSGGANDSGVNSLGSQGSSTNQNRTTSNSTSNSMFGNNQSTGLGGGYGGGAGGGGMGGFGGSGSGASANLQPLRDDSGPRSIVVGKTLLISDPTANSIFASGPPEHLRVLNEILDELDRRPQQILISVVIGELNLDHSKGLSVDHILRGALARRNGSSAVAGGLGGEGGPPTLLDPRAVT
ncbi:MAG TPA: secretin N-terminal domain-containing protein, partial [Prosthecobacter sp.]|nr:secretin N-terminal domain-containing protein [Prosthecobacter sp.]